MNEQELKELFEVLEAQGWKPQLCDTPVPLYDGRVPCGLPNDVDDECIDDYYLVPKSITSQHTHPLFCHLYQPIR